MKNRMLFLLVLIATFAASLLYVRGRFLVVELSHELSEKKALEKRLFQERRELQLELAMLKNPKRIEKVAAVKFGLSPNAKEITKVVLGSKK